jgi:hypothetical protein
MAFRVSLVKRFPLKLLRKQSRLTSLCETRRYRDQQLTPIDLMSIETIGEAHSLGWRVIARCAYSRGDGPSSKSSRECIYRKELDMETLVWTRGRTFPLSRLESRLSCPQCGSRQIVVLFDPPANVAAAKRR